MLCMETILKVRRLSLKPGLSQRAIAKQLQISRRTISKYLAIETKEPPAYNVSICSGSIIQDTSKSC